MEMKTKITEAEEAEEGEEAEEFSPLFDKEEMLPPEIANKRYLMTLESMRDDENFLWMHLNKCRITDKRMRKLFEALTDNTAVTSIDLSDNVITDEGMHFLTGVLAAGLAPNLIHINVRGNPISSKGRELLGGLYHLRKQLMVEYDMDDELNEERSSMLGTKDDWEDTFPRNKWIANCTEACGQGDSEAGNSFAGAQRQRLCNPTILEEQAEAVMSLLQPIAAKSLSPAELAAHAKQLGGILSQLLGLYSASFLDWTSVDRLPKGLKVVVEDIKLLVMMLDVNATPFESQHCIEVASAGLHRIAVVNVLCQLLEAGCPAIDAQFLNQAVPAYLRIRWILVQVLGPCHFRVMVTDHTACVLLKELQAVFARPATAICSAILVGSCSLPSLFAKIGTECAALQMGKRPGYGGHIVKLSRAIQVLEEKDTSIHELLQQNTQWVAYSGADGSLAKLVAEQSGHLGGPKPLFSRSMASFFQNNPGRSSPSFEQIRGMFLPYAQEKRPLDVQV